MSDSDLYKPGPIGTGSSFTGEFGLGDGLLIDEAPNVIERDRIHEAGREGFGRKLLPMKLGRIFDKEYGATRSFDRTSWIFSIWFPYHRGGVNSRKTLWPNSPPFPGL